MSYELWLALEISKILIPVVCAGVIALWIGLRQVGIAKLQAENARNKLRLDLFERRYRIYQETSALLQMLGCMDTGNRRTPDYKMLTEYTGTLGEAEFVFSLPIREKLREIAAHANSMIAQATMILRAVERKDEMTLNKSQIKFDSLQSEVYSINLKEIVRPDLDVSTIDAK